MSLRQIIYGQMQTTAGDLIGRIASPFYQLYTDQQRWVWACDVDIGEDELLRNVPVATNNKDILYADIGKPVALKKVGPGKYQIIGLAKTAKSTTHIIYLSAGELLGQIVGEELHGYSIRPLTYEELDAYGGYGVVPYGAHGRFDAQDNLITLI
jgi:hypothetical protein